MENKAEIETVQLIEALLFLENRPVNIQYISKISGESKDVIQDSVKLLMRKFKSILSR